VVQVEVLEAVELLELLEELGIIFLQTLPILIPVMAS
jgi:hypothetical protein